MHQTPRFEQQPDGTWQASYAGVDWSVTAATKQAAVAALQAEDQRRVESDPEYRDFLFQLARRNLHRSLARHRGGGNHAWRVLAPDWWPGP
jgi:hypothetical protein